MLAAPTYIAVHAMRGLLTQLAPHHVKMPAPPEGHETITFRTKDGLTLYGWWHQGDNNALVVLAHGHNQTRLDHMAEATALEAKGFSTLVFDLRAHGESEGDISTLGDKERLDVAAAIDTGLARSHAERLGLFGFSIGGIAGGEVAWKDPRVSAVVLVATDPTVGEAIKSDFRRWGLLSQLPALHVAEHHGIDAEAGHLRQAIPDLARRGLLVIVGTHEFDMAVMEDLIAMGKAAGAETLEIQGATHGAYAEAAPALYPARVVEFFERRLLANR